MSEMEKKEDIILDDNVNILGDDVSSEVVLGAFSGFNGTCGIKDQIITCNAPDTACTGNRICIRDTGTCFTDGICVVPDCSTDCSTDCGSDCVTDGVCSNGDLVLCPALTPCLDCSTDCTGVSQKIATDDDLRTSFGVNATKGPLCTTKSRAISFSLSVPTSYTDGQLVPLAAISTATATAATWDVTLEIILSHTIINIDTGLYGAGDGYLAPMNYSSPTSYTSQVSSPYFNFRTYNNFVSFEENMAYGSFRGYYTPANLVPGGNNYSVAQVDSEEIFGVLEKTFNSNITGSFTISLYMKDYNGNFVAAGLYHEAAWSSIRATNINLNISVTGVSVPATQNSGCVVRLVKDTSSIDSNGQGYFRGRLYLDKLQF